MAETLSSMISLSNSNGFPQKYIAEAMTFILISVSLLSFP